MLSPISVTSSLREFFTLARARRTAEAYTLAQRRRVQAYFEAAERRLSAARGTTQPVAASVLLREAVVCYLVAAGVARGDEGQGGGLRSAALLAAMPTLAPAADRPKAVPSDDERVRMAVAATDPLYFDDLSPEDVARARVALDRAASSMRPRVEARTVANLRVTRWGRALGLAFLLGCGALAGVRAALLLPNVALHKPVTPSSVWYSPAAGQDIVDGDTGTSFGVHTRVEDSPSVVIDLLDTYAIQRIQVHNRVDGWFDDCLPLVAELSVDGTTFHEVARRTTHFEGDPPWVVDAHGMRARYVKIRAARKTYLALSEVEVFGRKK